MRRLRFSPLLVALPLLCAVAWAQATPPPSETPTVFNGKKPTKEEKERMRDLSGIVSDESGAPIDGAVVQLKNLKTGQEIEFITKKNGKYLFTDLNMNIDYELTAKRDGYAAAEKKKLSKYDSRKPATLNFELQAQGKKTS